MNTWRTVRRGARLVLLALLASTVTACELEVPLGPDVDGGAAGDGGPAADGGGADADDGGLAFGDADADGGAADAGID